MSDRPAGALTPQASYTLAMAGYLADQMADEGHDVCAADLLDCMATLGLRFERDEERGTVLAYLTELGIQA